MVEGILYSESRFLATCPVASQLISNKKIYKSGYTAVTFVLHKKKLKQRVPRVEYMSSIWNLTRSVHISVLKTENW